MVLHLGEVRDAILEAVVRENGGLELAREGEDEVVGVGARGGLPQRAALDEPLVSLGVIDLVAERGVGDDDRLEPLGNELVAHEQDVGEARRGALARVRDVRRVDEHARALGVVGRRRRRLRRWNGRRRRVVGTRDVVGTGRSRTSGVSWRHECSRLMM